MPEMDIACPNCAAAYRVPDALVFSRKPVRCAACGMRWVPDLPEEDPLEAGRAARELQPAEADAPTPPPALPIGKAAPASSTDNFAPGAALGAAKDEAAEQTNAGPHPPSPADIMTDTGSETPTPAAPPPLVEPRLAPGVTRRARGGALLPLAWAASLLAMGGLLSGLALYRRNVAAAWPPFEWVVRLTGG